MMNAEAPITELLNAWAADQPNADAAVFDLVYDRLHEIATAHFARHGHQRTLQTTVVLNEAFLRLAQTPSQHWNDREHFFAYCSRVMRHVLVDLAKARRRLKRGSGAIHVTLDESLSSGQDDQHDDVLAVHQALAALERIDPHRARIVELRYFAGMATGEVATVLGLSESTIHRRWRLARAWLFDFLEERGDNAPRE